MANFDEIEDLFSKLLAALAPILSNKEIGEIRHFVDVGEYGLALETAVAILVEEKKSVPASASLLISRLAGAMSMDSDALLSRLKSS
jgi:hypothetical protein